MLFGWLAAFYNAAEGVVTPLARALGGGAARGHVVGASDRLGGDVKSTPVSPKDLLATAFHLLGYDPATTVQIG